MFHYLLQKLDTLFFLSLWSECLETRRKHQGNLGFLRLNCRRVKQRLSLMLDHLLAHLRLERALLQIWSPSRENMFNPVILTKMLRKTMSASYLQEVGMNSENGFLLVFSLVSFIFLGPCTWACSWLYGVCSVMDL